MADVVLALIGMRQMQRRNRELINAVREGGELQERILAAAVGELLDDIEPMMPVWTGAGLAAQRGELGDGFGRIFTTESVRNPITKARPNLYLRFVFAAMGQANPYDAAVDQFDFNALAARETQAYTRTL